MRDIKMGEKYKKFNKIYFALNNTNNSKKKGLR